MDTADKLLSMIESDEFQVGDMVKLTDAEAKKQRLSPAGSSGKIKKIYPSGLIEFVNQFGGTVITKSVNVVRK
jgi:hypothetical protein